MKRDLEKELIEWKTQKERYPLLIGGARQVGKSFLVEKFGSEHFKKCVTLNFEFQPQLKECFNNFDPAEIINKIQLILAVQINAQDTLLFLDEIQECPEAITALRYFREKMPEQAVIGAGSLLEFALESSKIKMPVGRIQFLYLEPLSFGEFLDASGNAALRSFLSSIGPRDKIEDVVHRKTLDLLRLYLILGGMPAVLKNYFINKNLANSQNIQNSLLQTFRSDFGKYARTSQHKYLLKVFDAVPRLIGQKLKYVNIDQEIKSRDLKNALEALILAGIIKPIYATHASGLPLGAQIKEKNLKLNFLDVGLMQNVCGLQTRLGTTNDFLQINSGAVAEQFTGQELRAYNDKRLPSALYYWLREKRGSSAEVDYVLNVDSNICPVEVKAGKSGTMKSLKIFLAEKKSPLGIRISQDKPAASEKILSIPLYMIEQLPRLIRVFLQKYPPKKS